MLLFVIPLKSKRVSKDWTLASKLFENCLYSVCNQIDPDFKIVVICHEKPNLRRTYDNSVEFVEVDFVPPTKGTHKEMMNDKWRKLAVGMVRASKIKPDFVMFTDADDLVSRKLSQYANAHKKNNGWMFKKGYIWHYKRSWIYYTDNYNCGTNAIINSRHIKFPKDTTKESISACIMLTHGHTIIEKGMKRQRTPLDVLPFSGGIHVLGHSDNAEDINRGEYLPGKDWIFFLKSVTHFNYRPLTKSIKNEFSMKKENI